MFARALVNQCRAIVLAMRAIRDVNPAAQLALAHEQISDVSVDEIAERANIS